MKLTTRLWLFLGLVTTVMAAVSVWEIRAYDQARTQVNTLVPEDADLVRVGNQLVAVLTISAIINLIILALATYFARRWVVVPLLRLSRLLRKVANNDRTVEIKPVNGATEIRNIFADSESMRKSLVTEIARADERNKDLLDQIQLTKSAEKSLNSNAPMVREVRFALTPRFRRKDIHPLNVDSYVRANAGVTSGDWWDIFSNRESHYLVQVDVEGHDNASAIAGLQTKAIFAAAIAAEVELHRIVKSVSDILVPDDTDEYPKFSTAFVIEIPRDIGKPASWLSAGHPPAVLAKGDGSKVLLNSSGPMLAGFGQVWDIRQFFFEPGMKLIVASDGLHELRNSDGSEFFEVDQIVNALTKVSTESTPQEVIEQIVDDMQAFAKDVNFENWEKQDDITIVAISRESV